MKSVETRTFLVPVAGGSGLNGGVGGRLRCDMVDSGGADGGSGRRLDSTVSARRLVMPLSVSRHQRR